MSPGSSQSGADRNLLFGILALQLDFVQRDALIQAMHAWVLDRTKPLGPTATCSSAFSRSNSTSCNAMP
jgi:hypothetical protein